MMISLKRAGVFEHLTGLVVGGMTKMNDNQVPFGKTAEEIIRDAVAEYQYPICFGFPAGHIDDNNPLILGRSAELYVSAENSTLKFSS
jgi:muramoyltetrapeptide carboxypeptidase